ncbi:cell division protein [Oceanobacillus sp. 143]|uniref:Cell division protein n=1 Tax=Oceanobacillus zhaokaii TaxID=2052660 RepID=A0A345PIA2_9BACI|nr:cell division protein FtsA [Oceanobacillus zhaokaii]AXI09732.1 cell division protein [Oceanobacillus zhaokaii]QGS69040.1 cell division protein [Oceanobacillus sp. 143]
MENQIFALDIGTRTVTGIILEQQEEKYAVVDYYIKEHRDRSMLDGQIHNVIAVADVIREVREELEKRTGSTLHKVCVAAAGRSLRTVESTAVIPLNQQMITDKETIKHIELSAVQTAQVKLAELEKNNDYSNYYCVGYSVLQYTIDNEKIGSLIDQSGEAAAVEIIATFLPKVVVESLLAALARADIEMEALTLEPIAAINVLIPESMRRLNVALVDIGAGTSDIAITDRGTVVAYGMVPVAGDEITEAISDQYLLDFPEAEQTKRRIVNKGKATVQDILGFETVITYDALVKDVKSQVKKLAKSITKEIFQLNGKAPKAVMLVGGGSLTPELPTILAEKLQLPANRVAVRGIDAIQSLMQNDSIPKGPDFITPIGIAIAAKQNPIHYISIHVNAKLIRLFEMKQLTVGDCLVQAGIVINKWYGKPGNASIINLNGQAITIPGKYGTAPVITLNSQAAGVEDIVHHQDEIAISKGADGNGADVTLGELIGEVPSLKIQFNQQLTEIKPIIYVNKRIKNWDYHVQDNDDIVIEEVKTIEDFLRNSTSHMVSETEVFMIYVNIEAINLDVGATQYYLNGRQVSIDHPLRQHDQLIISDARTPTVRDLLTKVGLDFWQTIKITFNGKVIHLQQPILRILRDGVELHEDNVISRLERLEIKERPPEPFIFQDVFRYVDIDLDQISGKFKLYKNEQPTSFDVPIEDGDALALRWD